MDLLILELDNWSIRSFLCVGLVYLIMAAFSMIQEPYTFYWIQTKHSFLVLCAVFLKCSFVVLLGGRVQGIKSLCLYSDLSYSWHQTLKKMLVEHLGLIPELIEPLLLCSLDILVGEECKRWRGHALCFLFPEIKEKRKIIL